MQYLLRGNYDAALRQLEGAKTSGAAPADVENVRGLALLLKGELQAAVASFDKALQLNAALSEARLNRAVARMRLNDAAGASSDFEAVYKDEHSSVRADAAYHNAIALDRLGRTAEAEEWLSRALTLDPSLDAALLYTGLLRERRGDLQGAGRAYLDYMKTHPESPTALLRFGLSAQKSGNIETAKKYLQRVLDVAPNSAEALEARKYLVMWE
ncbi:MAG TPA: tetratricopeptide repeat protein [Thermoanaerobaculia bacterium]|nr:tetratricopeptide repeat protein [Thermoanaerobaculia bacterium]